MAGVLGGRSGGAGEGETPLVLGLRTHGTRELADTVGGEHLLDVRGLGAFQEAFDQAISKKRPIILNVTGLRYGSTLREKINNAAEAGSYGLVGDNVTNWELYILKRTGLLNSAKFYENGRAIDNPGGW